MSSWQLFALGSAFFASLTAIFGKIGVQALSSNLATFIRTLVILLITSLVCTAQRSWRLPTQLDSKSMVFLVLSGLATGASWLCYYRALQLGPASRVAPLDKLSLALTILLAALVLGESVTLKTLLGGLLIVAGSLVLAA